MEGVDYSWARPGGAKLAREGKKFAVRYLYPGVGKGLTNTEIADLKANGLMIALVYQEGTGEWQDGFGAGERQARQAVALLSQLNLDQATPIHFTCDSNAGNSNPGAVVEFIRGASSVLGKARTGIYGSDIVVNAVYNSGYASFFWQTYAWSGGRLSPHATLYQYSNGEWGDSVDFVRAISSNFGQEGSSDDGYTQAQRDEVIKRFDDIIVPILRNLDRKI